MTIRKDKGELVCECEDCDARVYAGTIDFREFVEELKSKGWEISNNGGDWQHRCPDCVEE